MTVLYEQPLLILGIGLTVAAIVAVVLLQKGQLLAIFGVLAVLLVTGGALLVERKVVTDREEVENTIHAIAARLVENDLEGVLAYVSPESGRLRNEARMKLPGVRVTKAKVSSLEVQVNRLTAPPTASATFTGSLHFVILGGTSQVFIRRYMLDLARHESGWWITGYETSQWPPAPDPAR